MACAAWHDSHDLRHVSHGVWPVTRVACVAWCVAACVTYDVCCMVCAVCHVCRMYHGVGCMVCGCTRLLRVALHTSQCRRVI